MQETPSSNDLTPMIASVKFFIPRGFGLRLNPQRGLGSSNSRTTEIGRQYGYGSGATDVQELHQRRVGGIAEREGIREPQSGEYCRANRVVCVFEQRGCGRGRGCRDRSVQDVAAGPGA